MHPKKYVLCLCCTRFLFDKVNWITLVDLQFHILIASGLEVVLLFPTILLIVGASKRIRCLLLPFLVLFGLAQIAIMGAILGESSSYYQLFILHFQRLPYQGVVNWHILDNKGTKVDRL